jgi:hypothetical protein
MYILRMKVAFALFVAFACIASVTGCSEKKELAVTRIHPKRGPYMGGDRVTISGTGFSLTQGLEVRFGKNKATSPVIKEAGEIIVETPAGDIGSTVDVIIVFDDARTLTIPKAYTYYDPTDLKNKPPGEK